MDEQMNDQFCAENVSEATDTDDLSATAATDRDGANVTETIPAATTAGEDPTTPAEQSEDAEEETFDINSLRPHVKPLYKVLFILLMIVAIGASLYFSFNAISLSMYEYAETEDGWQLSGFHNDNTVKSIRIDYVMEKRSSTTWEADTSRPITSIREYALCCDNDIEEIFIGKDVAYIQPLAFYSCKSLRHIEVDPANTHYVSVDGILYNYDMTEIIQFPIAYSRYENNHLKDENGKMHYVIPDTVRKVGALCFAYAEDLAEVTLSPATERLETLSFFRCSDLAAIDLPDTLTYIGSDSFSYCTLLTSVYIPYAVTEIGHHALYECSGITDINVARSKEEFAEVKLGNYWNYTTLTHRIAVNYDQGRT